MADTATAPGAVRARVGTHRVTTVGLLWGQFRYSNKGFWRTPVAAFFTIVFPLSFLVILSAIYGNEVIDQSTGLRLAQYTTPTFAVFGATMACYVSLATALAFARANGVLKRLRGTPLPPSTLVTGRILSSIWIAAIAVAIMVAVGVLLYDVQIIAENVPALVLTFLVGTGCFAALGFAVAAASPTPSAAMAFANSTLILLGFISGIFGIGELPSWMERLASVFPLKPFVEAFSDGFNPYVEAATPDWSALAVMVAWGIVGTLITWRALSWEPSAAGAAWLRRKQGGSSEAEDAEVAAAVASFRAADGAGVPVRTTTVHEAGAPSVPALVWSQTRYAITQILRDPMSAFFGVVFPVLLVSFFSSVNDPDAQWRGMSLAQYLCASFAIYGVATTGFVNLPGAIADHRALGILKRLRGSPLPPWAYLAGRVLAALLLGLVTVALVFVVGVSFFDVALPPTRWAPTLLVFVLAIGCFAACGLALVAVVDGPQAVIAATLSILLPLSFISDIFIVGVEEMPTVLNAIGWFFPLRHAVAAAVTATSGGALDATFWLDLAVLGAWTVVTALLAWRFFHWEPRRTAGRRRGHPAEVAAGE
jgi:ABC-type multidrug transport system permease subunit